MAVISRWNCPAYPSAQTPTAPMVARECAVGQTRLFSGVHLTVGSPVEELHLFENDVNGMRTVFAPAVTTKSAL